MDKVQVSERALEARIKRSLEKDGNLLKKCRKDSRFYDDLGDYYIVDQRNSIAAKHCDLRTLAHEIGALKDYETLEGDKP